MNRWQQYSISLLLVLITLVGCERNGTSPSTSATSRDALVRSTEKGPVKLTIRVTPPEPRLSDLVDLEVEVIAQQGVEVFPLTFGQAVGDFLVRDYSEKKLVLPNPQPGGPSTHRFRYQLEPVHAGRHLIRSLTIEFVDNRPNSEARGQTSLIESEPLEVQVTSELGDTQPNLADLQPMLPPRPLQQSTTWYWWMLAVAGAVATSLAFWIRRRNKSQVAEPPKQTPEEIAHAALAALLAEKLPSQGLVKEFYLRLTGIVRQFIEGTTGLRAPEQTTEEFLRAMRSKEVFTADRSTRLKEFLEAADMVKYAAQRPDQTQIELSILRAREFVDLRSSDVAATTHSAGEV
jgi:hypothetical protein